jgi:hypothetical protein
MRLSPERDQASIHRKGYKVIKKQRVVSISDASPSIRQIGAQAPAEIQNSTGDIKAVVPLITQHQTGTVRDLHVRYVSVEKRIPYARNARTHTGAQVAQVAASIVAFGWTNPILIRPDGVIIAGHARLLAARQLGLQEVPVIELSGLTEAQCRALSIADNQLAL